MEKFLFVNFKSYEEAVGKNAVSLAVGLERAATGFGVELVFVVGAFDIFLVSQKVKSMVFGQHFDFTSFGAFTGSISVEALLEAGAVGSVLNHAERKVSDEHVVSCVRHAKENGFFVLLCAESVERAEFFAGLGPDFIAFEPPELIGGSVSVSTARPEVVMDFVQRVHAINRGVVLLCGAGIKGLLDVKKAFGFGCQGVFVSSGIVKAKDPKKALKEILAGFK